MVPVETNFTGYDFTVEFGPEFFKHLKAEFDNRGGPVSIDLVMGKL